MNKYELCVRGPTNRTSPTDQPMKLNLSLSETVAQLRSHIAAHLHVAPEEVFLVADDAISRQLVQFSHEPDEANKYPVAQLVKPGDTVNFQIGRSTGVGPFISGGPAASELTVVGTDTYKITQVTAKNGAQMSNEAEVIETKRPVHAEISNVSADGKGTRMNNVIASSTYLLKNKKICMMEQAGALKGLSKAESCQMFMDI